MKKELIEKLSSITEEERQLINSDKKIKTNMYWSTNNFKVEMCRIALSSEGTSRSPVLLRTHTRFSDFPLHTHDYIEMMYVCKGSITHCIGEHDIVAKEGDIIILGRNTKHCTKRAEEGDIGINMIISVDFFEALINNMRLENLLSDNPIGNLLSDSESQYCIFHTSPFPHIENILENIISAIVNEKNIMTYILKREIELLLCYLCFISGEFSEESNVVIYTNEIKRIVTNYIKTSYKNANLNDLSTLVGFSPTYMSRWIGRNMGATFKELLLEQRFEIASELLICTNMSVSNILNSVGYENSSYFHKQFIARYGTTPREYRKQQTKER